MGKEPTQGWLKHLDFILVDLLILQCSFVIAYFTRLGVSNPYKDREYLIIALLILLVDAVVIFSSNSYKNVLKRGYLKEFQSLLRQTVILISVITFFLFAIKEGATYSRIVVLLTGVFYLVLGFCSRLILKNIVRNNIKHKPKERLLIVTDKAMLKETLKGIVDYGLSEHQLIGAVILDEELTGTELEGVQIVAGADDVIAYTSKAWIDQVFVNVSKTTKNTEDCIKNFQEMGLTLHIGVMPIIDELGEKQRVKRLGNYMVVTNSINHMTMTEVFLKRLLDICGGLLGCLLTLVLILILGPMIYIQSPGPIFFKQQRVGKNGKLFYIYKFRSMYMDAEERKKELLEQNRVKDGMMFKLDWDPRIIGSKILPDGTMKKGLGNYIRDWSLDEFPQFFNVLKGDMSLVGTRPPTVDEWAKYEKHHRIRLAMKPGITGLWQVSGRSNIVEFEEVVKLDTQYIVNWDFSQDLKILFKTVKVVLGREGSM